VRPHRFQTAGLILIAVALISVGSGLAENSKASFEVRIGLAERALQGHRIKIPVTTTVDMRKIKEFTILLKFDPLFATLDSASLGKDLGPEWNHFSCVLEGCPPGDTKCRPSIARISASVEDPAAIPDSQYNNGAAQEIISLTFLTSNNRSYEGQFLPIRFIWNTCDDNSFSLSESATIYAALTAQDSLPPREWFDQPLDSAPLTPVYCDSSNASIINNIVFVNGGLDICCLWDIHAEGDINANGVPLETADIEMFIRFFIDGLSVFGSHVESSIAASDVNLDGQPLTISDLQFLIRLQSKGFHRFSRRPPSEAAVWIPYQKNRTMRIRSVTGHKLGAALMVLTGEGKIGTPVLSKEAQQMSMLYSQRGDTLRLLIYSVDGKTVDSGAHDLATIPYSNTLRLDSAAAADYDATPLQVDFNMAPGHRKE